MTRQIIKLELGVDDKSPKATSDKELAKAFKLILERAENGLLDQDDINFFKARREYLTDEQLVKVTGLTYDEIEESSEVDVEEEIPLSKLKKADLVAMAEELELALSGSETKEELINLIEGVIEK